MPASSRGQVQLNWDRKGEVTANVTIYDRRGVTDVTTDEPLTISEKRQLNKLLGDIGERIMGG